MTRLRLHLPVNRLLTHNPGTPTRTCLANHLRFSPSTDRSRWFSLEYSCCSTFATDAAPFAELWCDNKVPAWGICIAWRRSVLLGRRQTRPSWRGVNLVQFSADRVEQLREETARDLELTPLRAIIVTGWMDTQRNRFADAVLVISWQVVYWWWRHSERKRPSTCGSFYAAVHLISVVCVRSGTWQVSSQSEGKPALVWDSSRHRVIRCQLHNLPTTRKISA